jgi:hypothetical protein
MTKTDTLITEADIPVNPYTPEDEEEGEKVELKKLRVIVDGKPASCYIAEGRWSAKIVIEFDEDKGSQKRGFQTKHFIFESPGKMEWGHHGEVMDIRRQLK